MAEQVIVAIGNSGIKGRSVNVEIATGAHGPAGAPRPMRGGHRRDGGFNGPRRDGGYRGPRRDGGYRNDGPRDR